MPFLTLNALTVPVASHREEEVPIGEQIRHERGTLGTSVTDYRKAIRVTTTPLTFDAYETWSALLRDNATLTATGDAVNGLTLTVQGEVVGGEVLATAGGPRVRFEFILHW